MIRNVVSAVLLAAFALVSFASAAAVLVGIVPRAETHMTSGKILAGALISLGIGALIAAFDPQRHQIMIVVAILFSLSCAASIVYRLRFEHHLNDPSRYLLPLVVAYSALALLFSPFRPKPVSRRTQPDDHHGGWWGDDG